jgi:hypothetical protein
MNATQLQSIQETSDDLTIGYRFFGKSSSANFPQSQIEYSCMEADQMHIGVVNR